VLSLFGDTARALTVSPDNSLVYVAVMNSGNRSTAIGENFLSKPGPVTNVEGIEAWCNSTVVLVPTCLIWPLIPLMDKCTYPTLRP